MCAASCPVLGLVAPSGTGKTTLLKQLVPILRRRGLRIGYLKHAHCGVDLDQPGKDSYVLREAGAQQVLLATKARWILQGNSDRPEEDPQLEAMLARFATQSLDLILVEGFKYSPYPKIELHRKACNQELRYPQDPQIIAVISDEVLPENAPERLPLSDLEAIADFLEAYAAAQDFRVRETLVEYYGLLRRYGCNDSHSGNASVRVGDRFWITPTGACADHLEAAALLSCGLIGDYPAGASLDAPLHRLVYQQQPKAGAVLHSHGPYSVAMSLRGQGFQPRDFEGNLYFPWVPVLRIPYGNYVHRAPQAVAETLADHPVCLVQGHGVYAWGEDLNQAYQRTTALELSAKTAWLAQQVENA